MMLAETRLEASFPGEPSRVTNRISRSSGSSHRNMSHLIKKQPSRHARREAKSSKSIHQREPCKIGLSNVRFAGHPNSTLEPARIASSFDSAVPRPR